VLRESFAFGSDVADADVGGDVLSKAGRTVCAVRSGMEGWWEAVRRGGEFFVARLGVGGDGEIAGRKFGGRRDGELGVWSPTPSKESSTGAAGSKPFGVSRPDRDLP